MKSILIVDDDASLAALLETLFGGEGYEAASATRVRDAEDAVRARAFDVALVDLNLPDGTGLDLLVAIKALRPEISVILLTAAGSIEAAVEAMRRGADNFVVKPIDPPGLFTIVDKGAEAAALRRRALLLDRLASAPAGRVLGSSAAMRSAIDLAMRVAAHDTTVLIYGETGTGKGLFARMIHDASPRAKAPFVALNSAGLARELVESELFGHERGAFTGATERKIGLMEAAAGGTLFLDEIAELDLAVQAKLLTALEERRYRRVGGVIELTADVRLIGATHRDLRNAVDEGRFRADLFHRINVFTITLPPLRERDDDVVPLAVHLLAQMRPVPDPARALSDEAAGMLLDYDWPGNVREVRNVMERAAILCPPGVPIGPEHLPPLVPSRQEARAAVPAESVRVAGAEPASAAPGGGGAEPTEVAGAAEPRTHEDAERAFFERALRERKGSLRALAKELGISRGTLYRKARKYGLPLLDDEG